MAFRPASEITQNLNSIATWQSTRQNMLQDHFFLYGHSSITGSATSAIEFGPGAVKYNLIQSCVDTLLNKIGKNKPRTVFLTDNGDWGMRKKAEQQEKFVLGMRSKLDVHKKALRALLDCLVWGDGLVAIYSRGKEIYCDWALASEFFVDDQEAIYGNPRQLWRVRFLDKDTAKERYPGAKEKLDEQQTVLPPFYMASPATMSKLIVLIEYWKLPEKVLDSKTGKEKLVGGEHRIICGDTDIVPPEEWKRNRFPFAKIGFIPNQVGFWSKGVAETIKSHQKEVNRTLKRISDSLRIVSSPKVLYEYTSKIIQGHFNNDVGAMVGYSGTKPEFVVPPAVSPELFNQLQLTVQRAYEEIGISQLTANSQKPAGLNSGKALREYSDIETERFAAISQGWEDFFIDIDELLLEEAKYVADKFGNYSVLAPDKKGCQQLDFKSINIDKDSYVMQAYPTSMLPKTPSGRLEYVQEMLLSQLITPEEGLSLLDYPDTEKITKLKNAPLDDILATIDHMLDKDEYLPPETYQNLQLGIKYMQSAYLMYKQDGCPEEKLDLLIRWINDAIALTAPPTEPAMDPTVMSDPSASTGMPEDVVPVEGQNMAEAPIDPAIDPSQLPIA